MPRRAITLAVSAVLVLGLALAGARLPVPYVALLPGPTKNVLGETADKPLITISGRETYDTSGHLNLVTVAYRGGPGYNLDLYSALRGWLDPDWAVVPERALFPEGQTRKEVEKSTSRRMRQSQEAATVAALRELGIPVTEKIVLARIFKGYPARDVLRQGDVLLRVGGKEVNSLQAVSRAVTSHQPGETVRFTIRRDGERQRVQVKTTRSKEQPSRTVVGVGMRARYDFPFKVQVRIDQIGGPSAGLMFALGIVDKLTKGDLTGGRFVAGTGAIASTGQVQPIGGIAQKLTGAKQDGADIFLTPAKNCGEARAAKPEGLRLVKVTDLQQARQALRAIRTGEGNVPSC